MSLWQVDDRTTADTMTRYYEGLLERGEGRSEALRKIQLEMIASDDRELRHPNRWAAFVLTGDWRPL